MSLALNETQIELLKFFSHIEDERSLKGIKSLLTTYLSEKVAHTADMAFDEKNYTTEIFDKWEKKHFR